MPSGSVPFAARPREPGRADGQGPPTSSRRRPPETEENDNLAEVTPAKCSWVGEARRIDAHLRHRFPHLATKLYEIEPDRFLITFDPSLEKASKIAKEFHHSIRFVTVPVDLANEEPHSYIREVAPLSDADAIGQMTGLPLRHADIVTLLLSRFPSIDLLNICEISKDRTIRILVGKELDLQMQEEVMQFVDSFELPVKFHLEASSTSKGSNLSSSTGFPLSIVASRLRPGAPSYVPQDEAFWFDNIAQISRNELRIESSLDLRDDVSRCYLDLTTNQDQINLRQAIVLYDEVWCSLPLEAMQAQFLQEQGLTEDDLLNLAEIGRLRFVTTQPEERLSVRFLEAAHERNPTAILGRRTTTALLVSDVVRTAENSYFNNSEIAAMLPQVCDVIAGLSNRERHDLLRVFLWPFASRRGSLHNLLERGSWGSPVMDLAEIVSGDLESIHGVDLRLELKTLSPPVHVAHALNATLFGSWREPPGWYNLRSLIGWHLSFHRSFNRQSASSWVENEMRRQRGHVIVPTVRLFEFDPRIPITEIVDDTSLWSTRAKGRSLYTRLANLPESERQAEIDALEDELRRRAILPERTIISLDTVDTIAGTAAAVLGLIWPPLAGYKKLTGEMVEALRKVRKIDRLMMKIQESLNSSETKRDLDFLSRVSRVAAFRRDRV